MDEVLYSAKFLPNGTLRLAKWDGHKQPVEVYSITNRGKGRCDCFGSARQPYCKHRQMVDKWLVLTTTIPPFLGEFYDFDRGIVYTPLDGEGIPISGCINLSASASAA